jgi:hypothetical protein
LSPFPEGPEQPPASDRRRQFRLGCLNWARLRKGTCILPLGVNPPVGLPEIHSEHFWSSVHILHAPSFSHRY